MPKNELLIFIPTYNERENVELILRDILALDLPADILFMDDNSPDGTGKILDEISQPHQNVIVQHRPGKLGIGSAHIDGIRFAYVHGYSKLLTMDCDFTHLPKYIPDFLSKADNCDVVVGSRFILEKSLNGWNIYRKILTNFGHFLTEFFLGMPYDATSAFRLYQLNKIPPYFLDSIHSRGYSFFFESLYVLHLNNYKITETPTDLPSRVYGHSKMRLRDILQSISHLVHTYLTTLFNRERFEIAEPFTANPQDTNVDPQGWDNYWSGKDNKTSLLIYDLIAGFYRKFIIRPSLNRHILNKFNSQSKLLHAGCGSGQVDYDIGKLIKISALDISPIALSIYKKSNKNYRELIHGSIFDIPVPENSFDGIYNLGVMEHFSTEEIKSILKEFHRVVKPGGTILLFWPPEFGLSVIALKIIHYVLNNICKKNIALHPAEITRVKSRRQIQEILSSQGFTLKKYSFGISDLFTYVVIEGQKSAL